jgi:hypothetical protein
MVGSCECGNEHSGYMKWGEFLDSCSVELFNYFVYLCICLFFSIWTLFELLCPISV